MPGPTSPRIEMVPGRTLDEYAWWQALHLTINTAFAHNDTATFPATWNRLPLDPRLAARMFADESGPDGDLAVVLLGDGPVACAGGLPFRGADWINHQKSADHELEIHKHDMPAHREETATRNVVEDWELCCVCVHPQHRGKGFSALALRAVEAFVKSRGVLRLNSVYVLGETGQYWPRLGYTIVPGAGGILKKGFAVEPGMPGLLADVQFSMGCKVLRP